MTQQRLNGLSMIYVHGRETLNSTAKWEETVKTILDIYASDNRVMKLR